MSKGQNGRKTGRSPLNGSIPPVEHQFKKGNPGGPGRPPTKHIRERIAEMMEEGTIDLDTLIHELRQEDRTLFTAYAFGRPQADLTSGGKPITGGVVVLGPKELEDI